MGIHLSVVVPVYNERYLVEASLTRLLELEHPILERMDVIVVDDGSTDGTPHVLRRIASACPDRIELVEHERNRGKGAAVRTGLARARGAVTMIHDADLEYDPRDIPALLRPFVEAEADAVYGSRFLSGDFRRVLYFRHTVGNKLITLFADLFTDLNLTDVETCYKAVRTRLFQSIPIRSHDFRLEIELTFKLAKRGARIFEVPISYAGRTYEEGKKIGFKDAVLAFFAMLRWWIIDDLYDPDEYGSNILVALSEVPRFNRWMADTVRPFIGNRVLEIGAGIGNLTKAFIPRERYTVGDINPHYLDYLANVQEGRPYMDVRSLDLAQPEDFEELSGRFDTVVCLNVLEHVADEEAAVANLFQVLEPEGRAIVLVPRGPRLYGSLDEVLGHERRYTRDSLRAALLRGGFQIERMFDFNRFSAPAWWITGKILRRRHFSRVQLKLLDWTIWLVRRIDRALPWPGVSLVAVARRTAGGDSRSPPEG